MIPGFCDVCGYYADENDTIFVIPCGYKDDADVEKIVESEWHPAYTLCGRYCFSCLFDIVYKMSKIEAENFKDNYVMVSGKSEVLSNIRILDDIILDKMSSNNGKCDE